MNIGIVGLGLIGGSYAKALRHHNHHLIGYDINPRTIEYALENNIVDQAYTDTFKSLAVCDVIFVCLYPNQTVNYIRTHQHAFKSNAIVSDVSGVKVSVMNHLSDLLDQHFEIVFSHPIAGRETSGIQTSVDGLFEQMNFIITPHPNNTNHGLNIITSLAKEMGFKNITQMSADEHDQMVGYTSQLTHVIALSLVNASDYNEQTKFAIGDSYKDLTRIARMNEVLWSELLTHNDTYLTDIIEHFETSLKEVKDAIKNKDVESLKKLMIRSTKRRSDLDD
jgi:prephenate dehydrogenase